MLSAASHHGRIYTKAELRIALDLFFPVSNLI
jgi:hypothetical protein